MTRLFLFNLLLVFAGFDSLLIAADDPNRVDIYGDPLPHGAVARLGTVRYRHKGSHKRISFLADNETLVVGTEENTVRLWNVKSGEMTKEIRLGDARYLGFAVSRGGNHLAVLSTTRDPILHQNASFLRIWETSTWKELLTVPLVEPSAEASHRVAISPDGSLVVTGTTRGKLRFWDVKSTQEILGYDLKSDIESIDFSPDGELIVVASRMGVVMLPWRLKEQSITLSNLPRGSQIAVFSPDGKQLVVGSDDVAAAQLFEVPSGKTIRTLRGKGFRYYPQGVAFLPDKGQLLVPANTANTIEFFDLATGRLVRTLDSGVLQPRDVAVSRDGRYAAMIAFEAEIKVWNLESGELINDRFIGHAETPYEITFLPDGKKVATGSIDGTVRIWDAQMGKQECVLRHDKRWISALAVSADGDRALSIGFDDTLRLWETQTGRQIYRLPGHGTLGGNKDYDVAFTRSGKTLLSFGKDLYLRRWDSATGKALAELAIRPRSIAIKETVNGKPAIGGDPFGDELPSQTINAARFTADGTRLLLLAGQRTLHIFDVETGKESLNFEVSSAIDEFALSQNSSLLAVSATQLQPNPNAAKANRAIRISSLQLMRFPSAESLWQVELAGNYSGDLRFSPDGKWIGFCLRGESPVAKSKSWIGVYATENGKEAYRIEEFPQDSNHFTFSPDGRHLAASYEDSSVLIWELEKFRLP